MRRIRGGSDNFEGPVATLLERHGPMTIQDICDNLRRVYKMDYTVYELSKRMQGTQFRKGLVKCDHQYWDTDMQRMRREVRYSLNRGG